ncbi:MAG TPA: FHA domain-containing protein, partial [Candidatus Binatia bacterium]|nr:FHA domain-containing protein [Candidatus Binatia bacterium]
AIQQAIEQYASDSFMREQMDQLAIYRVGEEGASEALAPTGFYNSVRNFFSGGMEPQGGPTALIDSMVGLLNSMSDIRPEDSLASALVVFSDGTDSVSTQFQAGDVAARAVELGIPVHTVWLENSELTVGQEAGRNYLAQLAADAYGLAGRLDQPDTITPILERISAFRPQQLVRYTPPTLSGGTASVELSLVNDPLAQAQTEVTINAASPTVTLTVPADSRTLQLPSLDEPVRLSLGGQVAWLDGTERSVQQARLLVNGQFIQDVPPGDLARFTADVGNLTFGDNNLQLAVTDDQGIQAVSPEVVLTVVEGERQIPEALAPAAGFSALLLPICAGVAVLLLLGVAGFFILTGRSLPGLRPWRRGGGRRHRRGAGVTIEDGGDIVPAPDVAPAIAGSAGSTQAYLEVLDTATQMPSHIPLRSEEVRLGRSPALADVAFEQDITVSRLHASILWDGHSYRLYDDDSTSGTWVNDQEVPDYGAQLFDGDDIFLGKVRLRFRQR